MQRTQSLSCSRLSRASLSSFSFCLIVLIMTLLSLFEPFIIFDTYAVCSYIAIVCFTKHTNPCQILTRVIKQRKNVTVAQTLRTHNVKHYLVDQLSHLKLGGFLILVSGNTPQDYAYRSLLNTPTLGKVQA